MHTEDFLSHCWFITLLAGIFTLNANGSEVKGAHPQNTAENKHIATDCSHWSLIFDGGFNSFDGDFSTEMKHPVYAPAVGLGVEYSFTPAIGLGIDYVFDIYRVTGDRSAGPNADILLKGMMHKAGAYLAVDLMSSFSPRAERKLFSLQLLAGGGAGWFKNSIYYPDAVKGNTANADPLSKDTYKAHPFLMGGVDFEFNLCRSVALGIKGTYSYFTRDDVDGRGFEGMNAIASKNNDGIFDVTLSLRYKIDAVHKTHMRNIPSERIVDKQIAVDELSKPSKTGANQVPEFDTVVIIHKDTVVMQPTIKQTERPDDYFYVYFENGKSSLSSDGLITVQQLATSMEREPLRYAVVSGYCDNTGPESLNNILGEERAESVMNELIEEYGIDAERITACGRGKIIGKRSKASYSPNRRAEIRLVTREEFERMKSECSGEHKKNIMYVYEEKKQELELDTFNILDEVEVQKGVTLSQLARKYYQNTHGWVYIYKVNKQIIPSPNALTTGSHLIIPALTEAQRAITKDECLELYKSVRASK